MPDPKGAPLIAELECIPCLVRQAREIAVMTAADPELRKRVLRSCLAFMSKTDLDRSPPEIMQGIAGVILSHTGVEDPYRDIKRTHTEAALALLPRMERIVSGHPEPFTAGLRLAAAGNIIDLGARTGVSAGEIEDALKEAMELPLRGMDPLELRDEVEAAESILYLADNAGETVFDRKFIETFPLGKTTVAVRGAPALNDATLSDALAAGLDRVAVLVDNGSGAPATVLEDCSPGFRRLFHDADLVIAKGQGNYESLSSSGRKVRFLFRVKCDLVSSHSGYPLGSLVLLPSSGIDR